MAKNEEIALELSNKLQTSFYIMERLENGKPISENLINTAKSNMVEIEKLLSEIEVVKTIQSNYERSL